MPQDVPPLVPPEVDLRGMPFMPLDTVRLMDSDLFALSTGDEFKAAVALWCKAWHQVPAASIPDDDRILAHLSGQLQRWKKVRAGALKGWVKCSDGRLYHPVIAEKALEAWKHRLAQQARAAKRWHPSGSPNGNAAALPDESRGNAAAHAMAMQGTVKLRDSEVSNRDVEVTPEGKNGANGHTPKGKSDDPAAWWKSSAGVAATAITVGVERRPNESDEEWKDRVYTAVETRRREAFATARRH